MTLLRFRHAYTADRTLPYYLAPTQKALIVQERKGSREAAMVRSGLLPHWAKDERISYKLINARAETLLEKPAPVAGRQVPLPGRRPVSLACGRPGGDHYGEPFESGTIITTTPNELVAPVHDRMRRRSDAHAHARAE
jgi:putative SOS response-associated peptidase YedK